MFGGVSFRWCGLCSSMVVFIVFFSLCSCMLMVDCEWCISGVVVESELVFIIVMKVCS